MWLLFPRAIERVYKKYCEQNSKEQPDCLDSDPSEDLIWTDSTVWTKVLFMTYSLLVWFRYFFVLFYESGCNKSALESDQASFYFPHFI